MECDRFVVDVPSCESILISIVILGGFAPLKEDEVCIEHLAIYSAATPFLSGRTRLRLRDINTASHSFLLRWFLVGNVRLVNSLSAARKRDELRKRLLDALARQRGRLEVGAAQAPGQLVCLIGTDLALVVEVYLVPNEHEWRLAHAVRDERDPVLDVFERRALGHVERHKGRLHVAAVNGGCVPVLVLTGRVPDVELVRAPIVIHGLDLETGAHGWIETCVKTVLEPARDEGGLTDVAVPEGNDLDWSVSLHINFGQLVFEKVRKVTVADSGGSTIEDF